MTGNILHIPHYLTASTPKGLMRLMLKNNTKYGKEFRYSTPTKDGKVWITWFYVSIEESRGRI